MAKRGLLFRGIPAGDGVLTKPKRGNADLKREIAALKRELSEAHEHQNATSDILNVISRSPSDIQPVLDAIAETAQRLCDSEHVFIMRLQDGLYHIAAARNATAEQLKFLQENPFAPDRGSVTGRVAIDRRTIQVNDVLTDPEYTKNQAGHRGFRTTLGVPLLREGVTIGVIVLTRSIVQPFSDNQIKLLQTFADQAVIAIENVRLFNETQEALERQTATADILKVIASSPSDVQPVFDAIAERSNKLVGGLSSAVYRLVDNVAHLMAFTPVNPAADAVLRAAFPSQISQLNWGEAILAGNPYQVEDAQVEFVTQPSWLELAQHRGWRSSLAVPLMRSGLAIGVITVTRVEAGRFDDHFVQLLKTFADQAVIAIENTRLFNETREALERQTATADILKVIASSPDNVQPVFDAIAASANRLIGGYSTAVLRFLDGTVHLAAFTPTTPEADFVLTSSLPGPTAAFKPFELAARGVPTQIADTETFEDERIREVARARGYRSILYAPLVSAGVPIGVIGVTRAAPSIFAPHHVQLLQTFADQAVIAIENVRLFNETHQALEQQTATADILKVIASSPDDVQPVFQAIAERSNRIVDGLSTAVLSLVEDSLQLMAYTPVNPDADAALRAFYPQPLSTAVMGDTIRRGEIAQIEDSELIVRVQLRELARKRGWRSALFVPLLRDRKSIGMISVTRVQPGKFADHHVQLLKTFADQAVIAISNVELFREVQQRTQDLSRSLDDLRTAQDRLVQTEKLASLGQLTAGIAHEIKNPLNFVNNFSALSAELTDELNDLLKGAALTDRMREEVEELTRMLHDNLEKVVQHGKRADSIVKNMLLHSREGSGELRSADINALVDESLNLAYHGARAEKSGFNITLQRDFDASAGSAELFPQEITRALLNLISNGFYAATRRKTENGESGFEPTLLATTKDLGNAVEIRVRDNGTGIPPEVKEKMFNPFFTTKPAGEGTGLGLSMTHDIIVKQHAGSIEVDTQLGEFTEFKVILPRMAATGNTGADK
jgi:two-component system NtrC family sensor kinase